MIISIGGKHSLSITVTVNSLPLINSWNKKPLFGFKHFLYACFKELSSKILNISTLDPSSLGFKNIESKGLNGSKIEECKPASEISLVN